MKRLDVTQMDALVYRIRPRHSAGDELVAVFRWVSDAVEWVNGNRSPWKAEDFRIEQPDDGRKIIGATAHGYSILEALDRAEARRA